MRVFVFCFCLRPVASGLKPLAYSREGFWYFRFAFVLVASIFTTQTIHSRAKKLTRLAPSPLRGGSRTSVKFKHRL